MSLLKLLFVEILAKGDAWDIEPQMGSDWGDPFVRQNPISTDSLLPPHHPPTRPGRGGGGGLILGTLPSLPWLQRRGSRRDRGEREDETAPPRTFLSCVTVEGPGVSALLAPRRESMPARLAAARSVARLVAVSGAFTILCATLVCSHRSVRRG